MAGRTARPTQKSPHPALLPHRRAIVPELLHRDGNAPPADQARRDRLHGRPRRRGSVHRTAAADHDQTVRPLAGRRGRLRRRPDPRGAPAAAGSARGARPVRIRAGPHAQGLRRRRAARQARQGAADAVHRDRAAGRRDGRPRRHRRRRGRLRGVCAIRQGPQRPPGALLRGRRRRRGPLPAGPSQRRAATH